ncbi:MAG: SGNH/GDSL hydrolase family protein [Chloroflexi bacterium]|nr:SGNH/GDSL hydrolase family protein [Chloroflexota bacterium]
MSKRKRNTMILAGIVLVLILFIGINVALAARHAASFPKYWQDKANEPVPANAIRLVALGDSTMQAIGAAYPDEGIAGRIAGYLRAKTGRPVHVTNVSEGAATIQDIIDHQLPKVDLNGAGLIIVSTSSDLERRVPLDTYRAALRTLLRTLPPGKTIVSDLPIEPGRDAYQAVLQQAADERGIRRADFATIFNSEGRRLDIFSWLFPHLNSKGYYYWFLAFKPEVDQVVEAH